MIARMGKTRFIICASLILVLCAAIIVAAIGLKLPEATGKTVKKDGKMTIDCSNMADGYIMVKAKKTSKKLRVQVITAGAKLLYWLNGDGEPCIHDAAANSAKPYRRLLYANGNYFYSSITGQTAINDAAGAARVEGRIAPGPLNVPAAITVLSVR